LGQPGLRLHHLGIRSGGVGFFFGPFPLMLDGWKRPTVFLRIGEKRSLRRQSLCGCKGTNHRALTGPWEGNFPFPEFPKNGK
jgi:hypothetical protein